MERINHLIRRFDLNPHPEGGYYRETFRSKGKSGNRNHVTSIYFLLTSENFSAFHRLKQDEIWNFHDGSILHIHCISPEGEYKLLKLGLSEDSEPQQVVEAGTWFASEVPYPEAYSLVGCTVAPGFEFSDFEIAKKSQLTEIYPQHSVIINRLTQI